MVVFALEVVGVAAVVIGIVVLWIEGNRLIQVGDGTVVVALDGVRISAPTVRACSLGAGWIKVNDFTVALDYPISY